MSDDSFTESERATYQCLRSRGFSEEEASQAALDGVSVEAARRVANPRGIPSGVRHLEFFAGRPQASRPRDDFAPILEAVPVDPRHGPARALREDGLFTADMVALEMSGRITPARVTQLVIAGYVWACDFNDRYQRSPSLDEVRDWIQRSTP